MAEVCRGVLAEKEMPSSGGSNSRAARQKMREIRRVKFLGRRQAIAIGNGFKKARVSISPASFSRGCDNAVVSSSYFKSKSENDDKEGVGVEAGTALLTSAGRLGSDGFLHGEVIPKFGVASVCGWRREMEDAVAIHPSFSNINYNQTANTHFFGVYDGHGCSHVCCYVYNSQLIRVFDTC